MFLHRLLILSNAPSALQISLSKGPCRQREELGSKRSVPFPIQRTRVMRVTRDVLFHRFTQLGLASSPEGLMEAPFELKRFGNDYTKTRTAKKLPYLAKQHTWPVQADRKTWEPGAVSRSKHTSNWRLSPKDWSGPHRYSMLGQDRACESFHPSPEAKGGGWKEWSGTTGSETMWIKHSEHSQA